MRYLKKIRQPIIVSICNYKEFKLRKISFLKKPYFAIRGGSRKKIAKKRIPRHPTSKKV